MRKSTINIHDDVEENFISERYKTQLVNDLLREHYKKNRPNEGLIKALQADPRVVEAAQKLKDELGVSESGSVRPSAKLNPVDVNTVGGRVAEQQPITHDGLVEQVLKPSGKRVCKNGHLLGFNGRCLTKGCKYA